MFFNEAYAKLWKLDEEWLKSRPTDGAVLDRLRELGRLPEVVNYSEWKTKVLSCYGERQRPRTTGGTCPTGACCTCSPRSARTAASPICSSTRPSAWRSSATTTSLIDVQRETLDSLKEGVAVFGTDGRLKLFNSAFAEIWQLSRRALAEEPHIDEFIAGSRANYDDAQTWARLGGAVTSFSEEREDLRGADGAPRRHSIIDYAAMPLPDGATLFTFADVTDAKRYERALEERNEALDRRPTA